MMGIEQTKAPTAPVRTPSAPKVADKSTPTASGVNPASPSDFASLLASADEAAMSPQASLVSNVDKPVAPTTQARPTESARRTAQERKDLPRANETGGDEALAAPGTSDAIEDNETTTMVAASAVPLLGDAAGVPGAVGVAMEVARPVAVECVDANASVASVRANGANGNGLASTLLLQQAPGSVPVGSKSAGGGGAGVLGGEGDLGQQAIATAASARTVALHEFAVRTPTIGGAEPTTPPLVMELVGSTISRHQGRTEMHESEGLTTSFGSAAGDSLAPAQPDRADWTGGGWFGDEVVSEPVRFWLGSEQTQLADMTVDDVGGGSVDVTIRLQGKEAHVAFRAEESLARDALQSGSGQLKDLLRQEGLTLTGLSVGTTADNGAFARGGQKQGQTAVTVSQGGVARAAVLATDAISGGAAPRKGGSGRGVDLYV